jgi:transposase
VDRWHVGFCDLSGGQGLLAQVEGRTTAAVTGWLTERPQAWREQIKAVAIDMCTVFKAAIRQVLPHAVLVVDHFHVVQLANRAVTEVRRRMTLTQRGRRGRASDPEWRMRNRLTRSAARTPGKHVDGLVDTLQTLTTAIGGPNPRRVERERRPARPARGRPHTAGPGTRSPATAPLLHPLRRH